MMKSWLFASRVGVLLLAMAACAWGNDEWREFRNAEGGRSFVGRLISYDPARREVTVRMQEGGGQVKLAVDKLSAPDRKFVEQEGQRLDAARFLRVKFDKVQKKSGESTKHSDTAKTTTRTYPDARARDSLTGCVVWVKVGDRVVRTEASSPTLLGKYGKSDAR